MALGQLETLILLLIAATVAAVVARWVRLPYTLALLLLGLLIGASPLPVPTLSSDVILLVFLPPLLFEAAFVLDLQLLWSLRAGVLALAVPGVLLAMVVGGALVHWGLALPWMVALLFGAMIAATDPVAVLAAFRQLGVDRRLAVLIEGESLLNDGIALMLLVTLVSAVEGEFDLGTALATLLFAVVGGTLIGMLCGWMGHHLISSIDEHLTEMTVSLATAYGAFLIAEQLAFSGVLATIAAAMTLGSLGRRYTWIWSEGSERLLIDFWEFLAFLANAALFLLVGLTDRAAELYLHLGAVLLGIVAALAGRAAVAYGVGSLLNRAGFPLPVSWRHVLFWGGLRGAVALAAALSLPLGFPYRGQLLAMTYGVVIFTLLVQGLTIGPLVHRLGLTEVGGRGSEVGGKGA
jgi:CPA1 family monovalent cation:H+ antiporter